MELLLLLTILLTPAYTFRFNLAVLPANSLLVWVIFIWLAFLIYLITGKQINSFIKSIWQTKRAVLIPAGLLLVSGFIALAVSDFTQDGLGLFLIWFVQPISMFFIAR